jgi:hypothetical protein
MIKKIFYWVMIVVIVGGAVYSYNKVDFGRKTAMLFQMAFGDATSMAGPGGGPPGGARGPGGDHGQPPQGGQQAQGGVEGQNRGFQPGGGEQAGRPPQGMGPGGGPGGSIISVRNVIPYTFIFAFFVLIVCVIEKSIKGFRMKS